MRLDKYLADAGYGTRKEVKRLIKSGAVAVGSELSLCPETKIDEAEDRVFVCGKEVVYKKFIYLMLNKPGGVVTAVWDKKFGTVIDLVPDEFLHYKPFPVGRLDRDTEGLIIITNDGALCHNLLSPEKHIPKTYYAKIAGRINEDEREAFRTGIILDGGYVSRPAELEILSCGDEVSEIEITITEGKFHQIKRMFESIGKRVEFLKRIRMNKLELDKTLKPGEIRELTESELALLCGNKVE